MYITLKKIIGLLNFYIIRLLNLKVAYFTYPSLCFSLKTFRLKKGSHSKIGRRAIFSSHSEIIVSGKLIIGNNFFINKYSRIVALENIKIGNDVTIAQFVSVLDHDHAYCFVGGKMILNGYNTRLISIGNNVWIGDKVTICKGVNIGNNVIIGANSLVNKDIESNCIAAGIPCRPIKSLLKNDKGSNVKDNY